MTCATPTLRNSWTDYFLFIDMALTKQTMKRRCTRCCCKGLFLSFELCVSVSVCQKGYFCAQYSNFFPWRVTIPYLKSLLETLSSEFLKFLKFLSFWKASISPPTFLIYELSARTSFLAQPTRGVVCWNPSVFLLPQANIRRHSAWTPFVTDIRGHAHSLRFEVHNIRSHFIYFIKYLSKT